MKKNNAVNNVLNNLKNNVNFKIQKVPLVMDVVAVVLVVMLIIMLGSGKKMPENTKISFLLALIILISCYNIEIAIVVVILAIIYVLVQNNMGAGRENFDNHIPPRDIDETPPPGVMVGEDNVFMNNSSEPTY